MEMVSNVDVECREGDVEVLDILLWKHIAWNRFGSGSSEATGQTSFVGKCLSVTFTSSFFT